MIDNPYKAVRTESTEVIEGEVKVVHETGYDVKDRVVSESTHIYYPDGTEGYCARVVEADGYWNGGAYDPQTGVSCTLAPEKFKE